MVSASYNQKQTIKSPLASESGSVRQIVREKIS